MSVQPYVAFFFKPTPPPRVKLTPPAGGWPRRRGAVLPHVLPAGGRGQPARQAVAEVEGSPWRVLPAWPFPFPANLPFAKQFCLHPFSPSGAKMAEIGSKCDRMWAAQLNFETF